MIYVGFFIVTWFSLIFALLCIKVLRTIMRRKGIIKSPPSKPIRGLVDKYHEENAEWEEYKEQRRKEGAFL